ncbi:MAG: CvpA family protein [Granulosicoccus sp.]
MSLVDVAILAGILLSAGLGFLRGIIRSMLSLLIWLAAIAITLIFSSRFASLLPIDTVESPLARATISATTLFFGTLATGVLVKWLVERIFPRSGLSLVNRGLGFGFGFVRGVVLVSLLVLGANLVPELKQEVWWNESRFLPRFQKVAAQIHKRLPESIGQHFYFTNRA